METIYSKLVNQFGVKLISDKEIELLRELAKNNLHHLIRRKFVFAHRDFDLILERQRKGLRWVLYSGRGPSADLHLGHLIPWIIAKWFVDTFNVEFFFEMTDDEKFLHKGIPLEETNRYAYENALDLIALGFTPDKLHLIIDTEDIKYLYKIAVKVAKHLTLSTIKHTFGLSDSSNIGLVFFPAIQISVAFLPTELYGEKIPTLIPTGIDQDPYFRLARDVATSLGYPKPALIYCKFLPALTGDIKMSASKPETAIYLTDSDEDIKRKIMNAFTGGQPTAKLQRELGGNPSICVVYQYFLFFEENDQNVIKIYEDCRSGKILCGECKLRLVDLVLKFIHQHREKREKARDRLEEYKLSSKF